MLKKIIGAIEILFGLVILGWVGYNYIIEMQPATKGLNPIVALLFSSAAIYTGINWVAGKK